MSRKVRCPQAGCEYYTTAEKAEDAMDDLREHMKMAHDMDDIPDDAKAAVDPKIKSMAKARK
ncbi:DUF1059 domain-containing protein [Methanomassiliicoccus luminyensis]|jgi:predicted small metal-binding protein|uniref:DUF1059 domain-containing protein n=1 Tax=Methanomassiliicoccus luminyensis TaxID=1080712 RepID=UPI00036A4734|nr:DUF1059 domain-containing protein [Methanomassiliicoccus luminyensis]